MEDWKVYFTIASIILSWAGSWFTAWFHVKSKILILEKEVETVKEEHKTQHEDLKELVNVLNRLDVTMSTTLARIDERMKNVEENIRRE